MLISQGPLRVSLFGGGSDLPAFLDRHDGAVLSFAINRRVYVVGHPFTHRSGILLKYSQTEDVSYSDELLHPIAREVLGRYNVNNIDIAIMSDVPAGTGLGSSSSFTVAFLAFVRQLTGRSSTPAGLAQEACEIEIETLQEPIGYQDQWASALGGINILRFSGTTVSAEPLALDPATVTALQENLHLVPVGGSRSAGQLLKRQSTALTSGSKEEHATHALVGLVDQGKQALESSLDDLGPLLHEAWELKQQTSPMITNSIVSAAYSRGIEAGATGGKLLGAGGAGYLAFYVPSNKHDEFAHAFPTRLDFTVSFEGAGVIHDSP